MHSKSSLATKYKINKISEVSTDQLSDFYKKTYYQRYKSLTNHWRWWYRVGNKGHEPIIVSLNNKVIGQAAYLPAKLDILGTEIPAIWFVDYAVLPEFMGKGLGKILYKEWMKICPNQIAICSKYSLRLLKKKGWKENFSTKRMIKAINISKFLPIINKFKLNFFDNTFKYFIKRKYNNNILIRSYKINDNFNVIRDSFALKKIIKDQNFASIVRDQEWLHWRIMECPYKKDIYFFEYKNNFAIVHIFTIKNVKKLNILYIYATEASKENDLYLQILNWSLNNNIDVVWTISRSSELQDLFPKILNKSVQYAAWSSDEGIHNVLKNGLLDLQGIDTDIDTSLYEE